LEAVVGGPVRVLQVGAIVEGSQHPIETAIRDVERKFLIGVPGVTEILLVRHGDCYQAMDGGSDPPLSELGHRQAAALVNRLRSLPVAAVYASPLRRARETAEALGRPVRLDPRLVEAAIDWEQGIRFTELIEDVANRVAQAIDEAVAAYPGARLVMVSHGGAIMAYLGRLLQLPAPGLRLLPYFTSVSVVRARDDQRVVGSIADASHLPPEEAAS
jgi:probable phosphoglycerate mutase